MITFQEMAAPVNEFDNGCNVDLQSDTLKGFRVQLSDELPKLPENVFGSKLSTALRTFPVCRVRHMCYAL